MHIEFKSQIIECMNERGFVMISANYSSLGIYECLICIKYFVPDEMHINLNVFSS